MNISLAHQYAVICGSTQGIGLASARALASLGATCILIARNEEALKAAAEKLSTKHEQKHSYRIADFSKQEDVKKAIEDITARYPVTVLVNNTGGPKAGPIAEATTEAFSSAFQQHLICNQILAQTVLPGMKTAGYGRIINIVSTSVRTPLAGLGVSNTIRAAVASWAKSLSNEVGQYNITVNNVLPGLTNTARLQSLVQQTAAGQHTNAETVEENMRSSVPMKRFGEAEEIANVVAFLASPAASYVNGTSIPVDGGRTPTV
nr:SDR family oxidoreductase [Pedobacter sp. ASV19]